MKKVLITGAGSYVGESVRRYILSTSSDFQIDAVDTMNDAWKQADYGLYDAVFHVAGIAHVNADPKMEPMYTYAGSQNSRRSSSCSRLDPYARFIWTT